MSFIEDFSEYISFLGYKSAKFFYLQSFSKTKVPISFKYFYKQGLNLLDVNHLYTTFFSKDIKHYGDKFLAEIVQVQPKVASSLINLFAEDMELSKMALVLYPPFSLTRLADISSIVLTPWNSKSGDLLQIVFLNGFINTFDRKNRFNLQQTFPRFTSDIIYIIFKKVSNIINTLSIIGKVNKKYWDDSFLDVAVAGFILDIYSYLIEIFLSCQNIQDLSKVFALSELIDILDINSNRIQLKKLNKTTFKTTMLYTKLKQTRKFLDTIRKEYVKQINK